MSRSSGGTSHARNVLTSAALSVTRSPGEQNGTGALAFEERVVILAQVVGVFRRNLNFMLNFIVGRGYRYCHSPL